MTQPEAAAVWAPISSLKEWAKNPRKNDKAVEKVAASIKRFGFGAPIVAREADGEIIAGHTRFKAAKKLGLEQVPVRFLKLDPAEAALLALADNRVGEEAEWDDDGLAAILKELSAEDRVATGFDDREINRLLDAAHESTGGISDDALVEVPATTKLGDLWALGPHRLICGDCTDATIVARLMQNDVAKLAVHDPPYGIRAVEAGLGDGKKHGNAVASRGSFRPIANDDKPFEPAHLLGSAELVVLWGANHYADKLPSSAAWVVWDKRDTLPSNGFSDCELAWCSSGNSARIKRHMWNGMIRASERGEKRVHPTQKPIALIAEVITDHSERGDVVIDWYAGSGTTLLACEQAGRKCRAIELDPKYVDVIVARWEAATGLKAVREDGQLEQA